MSLSIKKLWNDYGIGGIIIALIVLYILYKTYQYFSSKSRSSEFMGTNNNPAYNNTQGNNYTKAPTASEESVFSNEVFSSVGGTPSSGTPVTSSCSGATKQNPSDLLPKDSNSQWAQLNPSGKGDLANINLLKAGYHIGIDTIGQTLRNANLQIRSEPPNPQLSVGPWNTSTIEPDFMRPPLELGQGPK